MRKNLKNKKVEFRVDTDTANLLKRISKHFNLSEFLRKSMRRDISTLLCDMLREGYITEKEFQALSSCL